jgi:DNA polymerase III delta prime subunit
VDWSREDYFFNLSADLFKYLTYIPSTSSQERALMPLVLFSGLPSSGKTTRALQLQKALDAKVASSLRKFKIHVINDDTLGINREVYRGVSTQEEV